MAADYKRGLRRTNPHNFRDLSIFLRVQVPPDPNLPKPQYNPLFWVEMMGYPQDYMTLPFMVGPVDGKTNGGQKQ